MKTRLLIFLLFFSATTESQESEGKSVDAASPKKGDEIWLEEKITPTTTWIENLVKPLTILIEQKINSPEQEISDQELSDSQHPESSTMQEQPSTDMEPATEAAQLITSDQAKVLAKDHIAGDVLHVKFLLKTNRYRIKLISRLGEIHIIYIDAASGEIAPRDAKVTAQPTIEPAGAQLQGQTSPGPEPKSEVEARP